MWTRDETNTSLFCGLYVIFIFAYWNNVLKGVDFQSETEPSAM